MVKPHPHPHTHTLLLAEKLPAFKTTTKVAKKKKRESKDVNKGANGH